MKRCWKEHELIEHWTIHPVECELLAPRIDRGCLGFAVLLKFFQLNGRFPRYHKEIPGAVLAFVSEQLAVPPAAWFDYDLKGRSSQRDREQVRHFLGFRPITVADARRLQEWLQREIVPLDPDRRSLRAAVADWCRAHQVEPPTAGRSERFVAAAVRRFEEALCAAIHAQLPEPTRRRLDALLGADLSAEAANDDTAETSPSGFSFLKSDPGRIGLASVEREVAKLKRIREIGLPERLESTSPKWLARYRARATTESIRELRRHAEPVRYTLLAAFCGQRGHEITDGLVDLLIQIVHRISVRAEKRITAEVVGEWQRVQGKTGLLFRIAGAALDHPDGVVREVLFPLVGESTLAALVQESRVQGPTFRHRLQTLIHRSYGHHYRRMLPLMLDTLVFRSNNRAPRPVIQAMDWLRAH